MNYIYTEVFIHTNIIINNGNSVLLFFLKKYINHIRERKTRIIGQGQWILFIYKTKFAYDYTTLSQN